MQPTTPTPTPTPNATALMPARAPRPPAWLGGAFVVAPPLMLIALTSLGFEIAGQVVAGGVMAMVFGLVESSRALSGWFLARATRHHGIIVKRGLLSPIVLCLPVRPGATAVAAQVLFAATNDLIWRVSLPRVDVVEFTVARRSLLSRTKILIDGGTFDAAFVVDSVDDAMSVGSRLGPSVREALLYLFAGTSVRRVRFTQHAVDIELPRRGNVVEPVLTALPLLRALADAIDVPPTLPAHALRAHSPGGSSTGF